MNKWSKEFEEEMTLIIKEWLKQQNKTQKDLKESLQANTERMPGLLEVLKKYYSKGGLQKLVSKLCEVENDWTVVNSQESKGTRINNDPFDQLDLLLEEIEEDCSN